MLTLEDLHARCGAKPHATRETPFGPGVLVFKIGGKMFAISPETGSASITLKVDPFLSELMREQYQAITPGYHTDKRHWVTIRQDARLPDAEIERLIDHAYDLVRSKLTKAVKTTLGT